MKILAKMGLMALVVLLLAAMLVPKRIVRKGMPDLDETVTHDSLSAEVTVTRDDWGVAHIKAKTASDAYFAAGYTIAQDRLFQIEVLRRLGNGTLAEIVGEAALPMDKISRTLLWRKTAERLMDEKEKFSSDYLAIVEAYVAGVNHYIDTNPVPIEFTILGITPQHITAIDTLTIQGYMAYGFAEGIRADSVYAMVAERHPELDMHVLFPGYDTTQKVTVMEGVVESNPEIGSQQVAATKKSNFGGLEELVALTEDTLPDFGAFHGSNSWVLSPDRSKTGGAILANDPHIGFTNPPVWYECHIEYDGFESYGVHLPLVPMAVIGHNAHKGWSMTMFENDDVDLYRETINPDDPSQVMYKGEWTDMTEWTESIPVKGQDPVELPIRMTPHGPIITEMLDGYEGDPISMWWLFHATDHASAESFYQIGLAKTVDETRSAVSQLIAPGLNISYADKDGNIAWWAGARLPIRPDHVNSKTILDGASGDDEILGYLPFSENPQLVNPPSGVIVTSNNMSTSLPVGPIEKLEGYWQPADRAWRIHDLLDAQATWSLDELKVVQTDTKLQTAHLLVDGIVAAMSETDSSGTTYADGLTGNAKRAYLALTEWNAHHGTAMEGATVHQFVYDATVRALLLDEMGDTLFTTYLTVADSRNFFPYALTETSTVYWDDVSTPEVESASDILRAGFHAGVQNLHERHGDDWAWGTAHTVAYPYLILGQSPLKKWWTIGPFPAPSHREAVAKMSWRTSDYKVKHGASMRLLIDYANYGKAEGMWMVLPTGNVGHILSDHYSDQSQMYLRGEYRMIRSSDEEVNAHAEHAMTLRPAS